MAENKYVLDEKGRLYERMYNKNGKQSGLRQVKLTPEQQEVLRVGVIERARRGWLRRLWDRTRRLFGAK